MPWPPWFWPFPARVDPKAPPLLLLLLLLQGKHEGGFELIVLSRIERFHQGAHRTNSRGRKVCQYQKLLVPACTKEKQASGTTRPPAKGSSSTTLRPHIRAPESRSCRPQNSNHGRKHLPTACMRLILELSGMLFHGLGRFGCRRATTSALTDEQSSRLLQLQGDTHQLSRLRPPSSAPPGPRSERPSRLGPSLQCPRLIVD